MNRRRLAIGTAFAAAALVSACGSHSTAPKSTASSLAADHLDSLAIAASAAGEFDRYRLLAYPIAFLAENGVPASVSLSVDGTPQTYQAGVIEIVGQTAGPSPTPSDSIFVLFAWTGTDIDELVYAQVISPDTLFDVADLSDSAANVSLDSVTVLSAALSSSIGKCETFKLSIDNAAADDFLTGSTCTSWNMTGAFSLYFTPGSGLPHSAFVLASQTLPGVRIVVANSNGGLDRIRALRSGRAKILVR